MANWFRVFGDAQNKTRPQLSYAAHIQYTFIILLLKLFHNMNEGMNVLYVCTIARSLTFPQFRGHRGKPQSSSLRMRLGSQDTT